MVMVILGVFLVAAAAVVVVDDDDVIVVVVVVGVGVVVVAVAVVAAAAVVGLPWEMAHVGLRLASKDAVIPLLLNQNKKQKK